MKLSHFSLNFTSYVGWLHIHVEQTCVHELWHLEFKSYFGSIRAFLEFPLITTLVEHPHLSILVVYWRRLFILLVEHLMILFKHAILFCLNFVLLFAFLLIYITLPPIFSRVGVFIILAILFLLLLHSNWLCRNHGKLLFQLGQLCLCGQSLRLSDFLPIQTHQCVYFSNSVSAIVGPVSARVAC